MALNYLKTKSTKSSDFVLLQEIVDATNEEGVKWIEDHKLGFEYFMVSTIMKNLSISNSFSDSLKKLRDYLYNNKFGELRDLILNSSNLEDARNHYQKEIDTLVYKPEREAGVYTCRKCKSNNIDTYEVQMKSGDEPMTVFATCTDCGLKWRE